jgi:hypothetical protein
MKLQDITDLLTDKNSRIERLKAQLDCIDNYQIKLHVGLTIEEHLMFGSIGIEYYNEDLKWYTEKYDKYINNKAGD